MRSSRVGTTVVSGVPKSAKARDAGCSPTATPAMPKTAARRTWRRDTRDGAGSGSASVRIPVPDWPPPDVPVRGVRAAARVVITRAVILRDDPGVGPHQPCGIRAPGTRWSVRRRVSPTPESGWLLHRSRTSVRTVTVSSWSVPSPATATEQRSELAQARRTRRARLVGRLVRRCLTRNHVPRLELEGWGRSRPGAPNGSVPANPQPCGGPGAPGRVDLSSWDDRVVHHGSLAGRIPAGTSPRVRRDGPGHQEQHTRGCGLST